MVFDELTPEQRKKAQSCATPEELLALAKREGIKLTSEELEAVTGGMVFGAGECKKYGESSW